MKNRNCPNKDACWDYDASNCEGCAIGQKIEKFARKIKRLQAENAEIRHCAEIAERALIYAVSEYRCDECPCIECNAKIRGSQECIDLIAKTYKQQAERELAEEKGQ